jgi:hypothetical protein
LEELDDWPHTVVLDKTSLVLVGLLFIAATNLADAGQRDIVKLMLDWVSQKRTLLHAEKRDY